MKSLSAYFDDYATYHRSPGNKLCHYVGIPMITVTLLGLLSRWVIMDRFDGGILLIALATAWYLALEWKLGAPFAVVSLASYLVGRMMPLSALWSFFVLGWILQFYGHYHYEKKSPAFLTNLTHILVGPLWVFASAIGYTGKNAS